MAVNYIRRMYKYIVVKEHVARCDRELDVQVGQKLSVLKEQDGWAWAYFPGGVGTGGWILKACLNKLIDTENDDIPIKKSATYFPRKNYDEKRKELPAICRSNTLQGFENDNHTSINSNSDDTIVVTQSSASYLELLSSSKNLENKSNHKKAVLCSDTRSFKSINTLKPFSSILSKEEESSNIYSQENDSLEDSMKDSKDSFGVLKIRKIINELISTEKLYIDDMKMICEVLNINKLDSILPDFITDDNPLIEITNSLSDIISNANAFMDSLEEIQDYDLYYYVIRFCELITQYTNSDALVNYCVSLYTMQRTLSLYLDKNLELKKYFKDAEINNSALRQMPIESFFLLPFQRITRYPLFIARILGLLNENSKLYQTVKQTIELCTDITKSIDSFSNNVPILTEISYIESIIDTSSIKEGFKIRSCTRLLEERKFLFSGSFHIIKKNKSKKKVTVFLFSDCLFITVKKKQSIFSSKKTRENKYTMLKPPLSFQDIKFETLENNPTTINVNVFSGLKIVKTIKLTATTKYTISKFLEALPAFNKYNKLLKEKYPQYPPNLKLNNCRGVGWLNLRLISYGLIPKLTESNDDIIFAKIEIGDFEFYTESSTTKVKKWHYSYNIDLLSYDSVLKISMYAMCKFSPDVCLGNAELKMDLLSLNYDNNTTNKTNKFMEIKELRLSDSHPGVIRIGLIFTRNNDPIKFH